VVQNQVPSRPHRLIIDCDPGNGIRGSDIDDGIAIALALAAKDQLSLEMVTVVAGNTAVDDGYRVARTLLAALGVAVPVHVGAARGLMESPEPWVSRRARLDVPAEVMAAWDGVPAPDDHPVPVGDDAAGAIVRAVAAAPGEITLVAVGPLTNVAHALGRRPELAHELAGIVVMGGVFHVPGFLQELNFAMDPEAADVVMGSGAKITLVPLDTTVRTRLLPEVLEGWARMNSPLTDYLTVTARPWMRLTAYRDGRPGCYLHDPLAVAHFLDPKVGSYQEMVVGVELHGSLTRGRAVGWDPARVHLASGLRLPERAPIDVMVDVDNDRLVQLLTDAFASW